MDKNFRHKMACIRKFIDSGALANDRSLGMSDVTCSLRTSGLSRDLNVARVEERITGSEKDSERINSVMI